MSALHDLVRALSEGATLEIARRPVGTSLTHTTVTFAVTVPGLEGRVVHEVRLPTDTMAEHSWFVDEQVDHAAAALVESLEHLA